MKNAWFWFLPPLSSVHFTAAAAFMVLCSLHSDLTNQWTLANYSDIFSNKYYTQAFVNSVLIAVSSSVIGLIGRLFYVYA